ncbi:MAG: diadenylate cyclase CdaA [Calditrichaeota bacterium]|nr:diadenylate cyclase CdaA [Calditrichota bacterium]MCB0267530.1 diadenylate cyclase CdaA [Calditrichota bacterium]MCB0286031.1 diadenylate cyclase CdaA [Calditrichota bacterium]MCB0301833.1 diadenylate cyclase CdaA [Calditrichota bacterium]MCB9066899.1 TIGR00159 family protein [Calditrichia bacterium]
MFLKFGFLTISLVDVFDIALISVLFFRIYQFIRGSVAARMMLGLLLILLFSILADLVNLSGISWIFSNLKTVWVIAFVIIFQPEFRRMLLNLGQNPIVQRLVKVEAPMFIEEVVGAMLELAQKNFGALIVLPRETGVRSVVETGTEVNARVSKPLLLSIFNPRSPLHDGAVVIQSDQILAAKCQLPLTQSPRLDPSLGMRHRAALGLSEQTDTMILVVSEETGTISIAENGVLTRGLNEESLRRRLNDAFVQNKPQKKRNFLKELLQAN